MNTIPQENELQIVYAPVPVYEYGHDDFGERGCTIIGYVTGLAYLVGKEKKYLPNGRAVITFKVVYLKDGKNIDNDSFREPNCYNNEYPDAVDVKLICPFSIINDDYERQCHKEWMDLYCLQLNKKEARNIVASVSLSKVYKAKNEYWEKINDFSSKLNSCFEKAKIYKR